MKLYAGRVPEKPTELMDEINRSLPFDIRLLPQDIATNRAWAKELARLGVFSSDELGSVLETLDTCLAQYKAGHFEPLPDDEDVHTLVERFLTESLGPTGARIHTGRSRNDQVVCDLRLYTCDRLKVLMQATSDLILTLADLGEQHAETLMAGTTHLQPALPISLGQFLLSLGAALERDFSRLADTEKRVGLCPLGAGAMAGSGFEVDREFLARELGFHGVLPNSVDAVSDRDFCMETVNACAVLATHLSRYAEQMIIWANPAFGYVRFSGQWSTGSSMMPQKRNPDAMELVRGKVARIIGASNTLMTLVKGVPLSYAKDLQEDKEPLFDALDNTLLVVRVFKEAIASASFNTEKLQKALDGDMLATDLADALAEIGIPFRTAHERVGALVGRLESEGRNMSDITRDELSRDFPEFGENLPELTFQASVARRTVMGGTAPQRVREQAERLRSLFSRGE